jgi:uncharacterized membrane protein
MKLGPLQLFVIQFENNENFRGDIIRELETVRGRGIIRVIDGLFVAKDTDGSLIEITTSDLSHDEAVEFGNLIGSLMGLSSDGSAADAASAVETVQDSFGFGQQDVRRLKDQIKPGTSALILLIEHVWAISLGTAILSAGGHVVAQGMLTRDALLIIGNELEAVAEAEATLELADAIKGAAILDALATIAEARYVEAAAVMEAEQTVAIAEAIKAAAAADAVRALVIAGMIEEAAVEEAIAVLREAELIEEAAIKEAAEAAEASRKQIEALKAEVDAPG